MTTSAYRHRPYPISKYSQLRSEYSISVARQSEYEIKAFPPLGVLVSMKTAYDSMFHLNNHSKKNQRCEEGKMLSMGFENECVTYHMRLRIIECVHPLKQIQSARTFIGLRPHRNIVTNITIIPSIPFQTETISDVPWCNFVNWIKTRNQLSFQCLFSFNFDVKTDFKENLKQNDKL